MIPWLNVLFVDFFLGKEHSLFAPFMSKAHSLSVLNLWNNFSVFALIQSKNYSILLLIRSKNYSWNSLFNRFTILIWWLFDIRTNLILRLFWNWVYSGRRTFGWKTIQSLLTLPNLKYQNLYLKPVPRRWAKRWWILPTRLWKSSLRALYAKPMRTLLSCARVESDIPSLNFEYQKSKINY